MIKKEKGVTLISLIITIVLMSIIAGTVVYTSLDRLEANNAKKMINDIELLEDKVANYYLKYNTLPVLKSSNTAIKYTKSDFTKSDADGGDYYILDLEAMSGISLNYGQKGFQAFKKYGTGAYTSEDVDDIYIINSLSHNIYYVRGIDLEGDKYHYIPSTGTIGKDEIPPSSPKINIISGTKNSYGLYLSPVEIEIIPGKDNWSGIGDTQYSTKKDEGEWSSWKKYTKIIKLEEEYTELDGKYTIKARTYDKSGNVSQEAELEEFEVHVTHEFELVREIAATCTMPGEDVKQCTYENCNYVETETIDALGHSTITETIAATCTTAGSEKTICTRSGCDYEISTTLDALGHSYGGYVTTVAATCTTSGVETRTCTRSGCTAKTTRQTTALGHQWISLNLLVSVDDFIYDYGGGDVVNTLMGDCTDCNHRHICFTHRCNRREPTSCSAYKFEVQAHFPKARSYIYANNFYCHCGSYHTWQKTDYYFWYNNFISITDYTIASEYAWDHEFSKYCKGKLRSGIYDSGSISNVVVTKYNS